MDQRRRKIAEMLGIHPATVEFYEELGLLSKSKEQKNMTAFIEGITDAQFDLAVFTLRTEIRQNGLRGKAMQMLKAVFASQYDEAILLAKVYSDAVQFEKQNVLEVIEMVKRGFQLGPDFSHEVTYTTNEVLELLGLTIDMLRNWELNDLIAIKKSKKGHRIFHHQDIMRLQTIKALRCSNCAIQQISELLASFPENPKALLLTLEVLLHQIAQLNSDIEVILEQLKMMGEKKG